MGIPSLFLSSNDFDMQVGPSFRKYELNAPRPLPVDGVHSLNFVLDYAYYFFVCNS